MIISASRRTDIPAFYSEWFMNRLREKEVLVPNPYNRKKVSHISLKENVVDCIVFWSKNPQPLLKHLKEIDEMGYKYYFQISMTDYENDIEENVPDIADSMATFLLMSERLGKERMDWRFDPILLNDKYTKEYHLDQFNMMCRWLHKSTTRCIISFVDEYKDSMYPELKRKQVREMAEGIGRIAAEYNLPVYTCGEKEDLTEFGIRKGACIDKDKIHRITGYNIDLGKDTGQRKECRCLESIDIGMYDSCLHGCKYCYATANYENARKKNKLHDPLSPMLIGNLKGDEIVTERDVRSSRDHQMSLFDLPEMFMNF